MHRLAPKSCARRLAYSIILRPPIVLTYTYDAGQRLTEVADSVAGTITRTYDGLERLSSETTPQGTVTYTDDADSRRATMTVSGQPAVSYGYDAAERLITITQGASVFTFTHDDANRRTSLTFPNGIVATYEYDPASAFTRLAYQSASGFLGDATYTYDARGNRVAMGGSWVRVTLPMAVASAVHDVANQLTQWAGQIFSYDANGNLTSDGANGYTWNARDQLSGLTGAAICGVYACVGHRARAQQAVAAACRWGMAVGGAGFFAGFVGPIMLAMGNQRPLLGCSSRGRWASPGRARWCADGPPAHARSGGNPRAGRRRDRVGPAGTRCRRRTGDVVPARRGVRVSDPGVRYERLAAANRRSATSSCGQAIRLQLRRCHQRSQETAAAESGIQAIDRWSTASTPPTTLLPPPAMAPPVAAWPPETPRESREKTAPVNAASTVPAMA